MIGLRLAICSFLNLLQITKLHASGDATTFVIHFQPNATGSHMYDLTSWAEYIAPIPQTLDFTACTWIKVNFYSRDLAVVLWTYCSKSEEDAKELRCLDFFLKPIRDSGNRNLQTYAWYPWWHERSISAELNPEFSHRQWVHLCWCSSSLKGQNTFYYNGKLQKNVTVSNPEQLAPIEKSRNGNKSAFILGQDQDRIKGDFSKGSLFYGDMTELNIWDHVKSLGDIERMSRCEYSPKGNVISWNQTKFQTNEVLVTTLSDPTDLCKRDTRFFIFPERRTLLESKKLCEIHGGRIGVPHTEEENHNFTQMLRKYESRCENMNTGTSIWLGTESNHSIWYEINQDRLLSTRLNYTNFKNSDTYVNAFQCAYLTVDGNWYGGKYECNAEKFCTICAISGTPLFTLKGICMDETVDNNYYLTPSTNHTVDVYEGYKSSNLMRDGNKWKIKGKGLHDQEAIVEINITKSMRYPIGRMEWEVYEPACGIMDRQKINLTLSICEFGKQFTCDSGHCLDLSKRCDNVNDCKDGSDEYHCRIVSIPDAYDRHTPQEHQGYVTDEKIIKTRIKIITIDEIDTLRMKVSLTIRIYMEWNDTRLTYLHLNENSRQMIRVVTAKKLWIPLNEIVYENASDIMHAGDLELAVTRKSTPIAPDYGNAMEAEGFNGSMNPLDLKQTLKTTYKCNFNIWTFPFDYTVCNFTLRFWRDPMISRRFKDDSPVLLYEGNEYIDQFFIDGVSKYPSQGERFIFSISIQRTYVHSLLITFFPTAMLGLLSYSTIFIDVNNFNNRFMGSLTCLLVLAALLQTVNEGLPKTPYFKLIDLWFLWHIAMNFGIILYHTVLDKYVKNTDVNTRKVIKIQPNNKTGCDETTRLDTKCKEIPKDLRSTVQSMNQITTILLPVVNAIFYFIYFGLSSQLN